jgi:hypothetical protein
MPERLTSFICSICQKPVSLQACTTDAFGGPVHPDCYAQVMKEEKAKHKVASGKGSD